MNPIFHPDADKTVPTTSRDALPFLLLGAAALSAAALWLRYRATDPMLEARTRQRLAAIRNRPA